MKKFTQILMLAISILATTQANAGDTGMVDGAPVGAKYMAVRRLADIAARDQSTEDQRKEAIDRIGNIVKSMSPNEQENALMDVYLQNIATGIRAMDRADEHKDAAANSATILAVAFVIAIVTPKMGRISRLAAGAAIGAGISAMYSLYVSNGIVSDTEAHTRELQKAMRELIEELRLKNKANLL